MGKAHQIQKKTTQPESETNELATWKNISIINRKQTPIQSSAEIHVDLWNSAMGDSLQFQHRNPPALAIQDSPIHFERTFVNNNRIHEDLQIKKWNTKYLRELGN
jgi:hypothetical protein